LPSHKTQSSSVKVERVSPDIKPIPPSNQESELLVTPHTEINVAAFVCPPDDPPPAALAVPEAEALPAAALVCV
jgi:hypothetical protein